MLATLFGDVALVELLLKHGADPNTADNVGATALMWAVPDLQKARVLIGAGAMVNARSTTLGRTPLLIAAAYPGTIELLDLLLARGADLRATDTAGSNALGMRGADIEVSRFLVATGLSLRRECPAPPSLLRTRGRVRRFSTS